MAGVGLAEEDGLGYEAGNAGRQPAEAKTGRRLEKLKHQLLQLKKKGE